MITIKSRLTRNLICSIALISLIIFQAGCKKTDIPQKNNEQPTINWEEKFFAIPDNINPTVLRVINKIKEQNDRYHFVSDFVQKHGLPKWEFADVYIPGRNNYLSAREMSESNPDTMVLIPVANDVLEKIKDVLACDVNATEIAIKLIQDYSYKYYGYEPNPDGSANAKDIAQMFMKFETKVYDHRFFEVTDVELAKKILGNDWVNELTNLIIKKDPVIEKYDFFRAMTVAVVVPVPTLPEVFVINYVSAPTSSSSWSPITFGTGLGGYGGIWWSSSSGNGNSGNEGGNPGDGGGSNPSTGTSGGSSSIPGNNIDNNPGWLIPPCGGYWEGEVYKKNKCDDLVDHNGFLISRINQLNLLFNENAFAIDPCDKLTLMNLATYGPMYQRVAQYQAPQSVIDRLNEIRQAQNSWGIDNYNIQNLEDAYGPVVNCDYFPLQITAFPTNYSTGTPMTPSEFLEYFRLNINQFITQPIDVNFSCSFGPGFDDCPRWNQPYAGALGGLTHIYIPGPQIGPFTTSNSGSVILSDYKHINTIQSEQHYFKFSTLETPFDNEHPVAGNREFGIFNNASNPGNYTFYTLGIDRTWDWITAVSNFNDYGFDKADELWTNIQQNLITYINENGGHALNYSNPKIVARPFWDDVKDFLQGTISMEQLKIKLGC